MLELEQDSSASGVDTSQSDSATEKNNVSAVKEDVELNKSVSEDSVGAGKKSVKKRRSGANESIGEASEIESEISGKKKVKK